MISVLFAFLIPIAPPTPIHHMEPNVMAITVDQQSRMLGEILEIDACRGVVPVAIEAGWDLKLIPQLLKTIWRESRCLPEACGETDRPDLRKCRDWGLLQINDYTWKEVVEMMNLRMEQMLDPYYNLAFGKWMYDYSLNLVGDGWKPWQMPPQG